MDFDTFFADSWSDMLARALMLSGWDRISGYDNPGAWVYKFVRQRLWKSARGRPT